MVSWNLVNITSGIGLVPDGTPMHNLKQCWLAISEVLWHSSEGDFTGNVQDIYPHYEFDNDWFKIIASSPRRQWINTSISKVEQVETS